MPNWCYNSVTFKHSDKAQIERMKTAFLANELLNTFVTCPLGENDDWYSWNIENWGTKWDVDGHGDSIVDIDDNEITLYFDTAWSPPIQFYENLERQGWTVDAYYYEPGMNFCGRWVDGEDDYYEIPSDVDEVERTIPHDIEQTFNIMENVAMWQENEDAGD